MHTWSCKSLGSNPQKPSGIGRSSARAAIKYSHLACEYSMSKMSSCHQNKQVKPSETTAAKNSCRLDFMASTFTSVKPCKRCPWCSGHHKLRATAVAEWWEWPHRPGKYTWCCHNEKDLILILIKETRLGAGIWESGFQKPCASIVKHSLYFAVRGKELLSG